MKNLKRIAMCLVVAVVAVGAAAQRSLGLVVNEVMVSNGGMYLDPSFNYGSWIEVYNPTNKQISLDNLYVSDDAENLKKFRLPMNYGSVRAYGYACIYFDHNGIWNDGEVSQVNFKLKYDGGTIYLSDASGAMVSQDYPAAISRTSYARINNGGSVWGVTDTPTPGKSNSNSKFATEQLAAPVFEGKNALFADMTDVSISVPEDVTLAVTFDGSVPSLDNGMISEGSFETSISETMCVRARAFKDGMLPSNVVTRTYIKNYGFTLPIISIAGDREDIYGEDHGIMYDGYGPNGRAGNGQHSPRNYNMDWDRPVNFEYIDQKGEYALSQEVDMTMCGGWSRAYKPHSFKLKAAKYHMGLGTMDYPFFGEKPYIKHKALQIRQGGNDYTSRSKDVALQKVVSTSGLYIDTQESQPVHVFINGDYHATLNMREPNNKHFAYSNYGFDSDELDQFEMSPDSGYVQKEGTDEAFLRWYDLSFDAEYPDAYREITQLVDIDEYINYMAVEFYLANRDWPQNNVKGFRSTNDGKFHFVLFDLDQAFDVGDAATFTTFAGKKTYNFNALLSADALGMHWVGEQKREEVKMVTIFLNMLKNETFRNQFINTFCIVGGSVFEPTRVNKVVTGVKDMMNAARAAMDADFRYYTMDNNNSYNPTTSTNALITKLTADRNTTLMTAMKNYSAFGLSDAPMKSIKLMSNIDEATLMINDVVVPTGYFSGKVFCPTVFSVKVPAGYRFRGWTRSLVAKKDINEYEYLTDDLSYEMPTKSSPTVLRAIFEPVSDTELAEMNRRPVMINEVCAKNSIYVNDSYKKADWIELYNTTDKDIDLAGMYITDNMDKPTKYQIPVGDESLNTIIPAHGYKVVWTDKNASVRGQLHTGFKLDADGDIVMISAVPGEANESLFTDAFNGEWCDTLVYTAMEEGQTVGRYPDGGMSTYLMTTPTIGKSNQIGFYSEMIWEDPLATAIEAVEVKEDIQSDAEYYTIGGIRICHPQKGLNIVKKNGKVRKVWY